MAEIIVPGYLAKSRSSRIDPKTLDAIEEMYNELAAHAYNGTLPEEILDPATQGYSPATPQLLEDNLKGLRYLLEAAGRRKPLGQW